MGEMVTVVIGCGWRERKCNGGVVMVSDNCGGGGVTARAAL